MISVITPIYNMEQFIEDCIRSVAIAGNPLGNDYEHIVIDDGSTDKTNAIITQLQNDIDNLRIIKHEKNLGASVALNTGVKNARGEYICWLSADDRFLPDKLQIQLEYMEAHKDIDISFTDFAIIVEDKRIPVKCEFPKGYSLAGSIISHNQLNGSSSIIRAKVFPKIGYFDEMLKADTDADFWLRALHHGLKIGHIPKELIEYRIHDNNMSRNVDMMNFYKDMVRERWIERLSPQELFSGPESNYGSKYRILASTMHVQGLYKSMQACLNKREQVYLERKKPQMA